MGVDGADDDADNDAKYVKRQSALQRSIKRFFPAAFQPTLPVTTRYASQADRPTVVADASDAGSLTSV